MIADGLYDNRTTRCREVWEGGKCVAFWTDELLRSGHLPPSAYGRELPPWGSFPHIAPEATP